MGQSPVLVDGIREWEEGYALLCVDHDESHCAMEAGAGEMHGITIGDGYINSHPAGLDGGGRCRRSRSITSPCFGRTRTSLRDRSLPTSPTALPCGLAGVGAFHRLQPGSDDLVARGSAHEHPSPCGAHGRYDGEALGSGEKPSSPVGSQRPDQLANLRSPDADLVLCRADLVLVVVASQA